MGWEDLLEEESELVLPWYGRTKVHSEERTWTLHGDLPSEHGWYSFLIRGRKASLVRDEDQGVDPSWVGIQYPMNGYIVGDRFINDSVKIEPDPSKLVSQTDRVYCLEPGLERFSRAKVVRDRSGFLIFIEQSFPLGAEELVREAYEERRDGIRDIPGVTPSLELAFRWVSHQRYLAEERRRELERLREEEAQRQAARERLEQAMRDAGTAAGRRALAQRDFGAAAREALRVSGAELLDFRQSYAREEMVVRYRFRHQRFECVVDKTLRIVDSGICLTDHDTGVKGDSWLTLESLPGTVGQAMDEGKLVVYRHA